MCVCASAFEIVSWLPVSSACIEEKNNSGLFVIEIVARMFARKWRLLPWLSRIVYTDSLKAAEGSNMGTSVGPKQRHR